jgi:hypothetical protein
MQVLERQRTMILLEDGVKHGEIYRGVLELLARFGYVSIRELMYGWGLEVIPAADRLKYLRRTGLITRFPSLTVPTSFYCLTPKGRSAVQQFGISDELSFFTPGRYQLVYQEHHRSIIRVFLALRRVFGSRFLGWASERTLRAEEGARQEMSGGQKRVLDGEFFADIEKARFKVGVDGGLEPSGEAVREQWRCGLEVEISLKSPERYRKQFKELAHRVYDSLSGHQHYAMVMFFYNTRTLHDRLARHFKSGHYNFGSCIFYLAQIEEFLADPEHAVIEKFVGTESKTIVSSQMTQVRVVAK